MVDPSDTSALVGFEVTPSEATIVCTNGHANFAEFSLVAIREDGTREVVDAEWSLLSESLGEIDASGVFTARGDRGCVVRVEAIREGASFSALARVQLLWPSHQGVVPASIGERFDEQEGSLDPSPIALLYPLDEAVMPGNVAPPNVQWRGARFGDRVRVVIERPHARIEMFGDAEQDSFLPSAEAWRALTETDLGAEITLRVDRLDAANELWTGAPLHVHLTSDSLSGALYMYEIHRPMGGTSLASRVVRVLPERPGVREILIPYPPPHERPNHHLCTGCHEVSANGHRLAATGHGFNFAFDLTSDLSGYPTPSLFTEEALWTSAAYDPSGEVLITTLSGESADDRYFGLINGDTAETIPMEGAPDVVLPGDVQWSRDGSMVAYVTPLTRRWSAMGILRFSIEPESKLWILPRTGRKSFGEPLILHRGEELAEQPEGGAQDSNPAWSPDGRWIAFQHGPLAVSKARTEIGGEVRVLPGAIYLLSAEGGRPIRLDRAMGEASFDDAYYPYFAPNIFHHEGTARTWLAFSSRRGYGNIKPQESPRLERPLGIWVTAIDLEALEAGRDPSSVPYWLPEQSAEYGALRARWVSAPCQARGAACSSSSECCGGRCDRVEGALICVAPEASDCRGSGRTCDESSDCCGDFVCAGNVCQRPLE